MARQNRDVLTIVHDHVKSFFARRKALLVLAGVTFGLIPVASAASDDAGADERERLEIAAIQPADAPPPITGGPGESDPDPPGWIRYTSKGTRFGSDEGPLGGKMNVRSQLRFSSPFRSAPRRAGHFERPDEGDLRFRRVRFKIDGHLGEDWITYKYEHDLVDGRLLDLRFDIGPEWMKLRLGQWKADYSRERMDSSGKQQFTERSIVNRAFTIDRQKGATLLGRLNKNTAKDMQYFAGVFTGQGRGVFRDPRVPRDARDGSPMWLLRYQWNPVGGGVGLSQSDLEPESGPRLSVAVATSGNRSSYTRFSSSGGGQLDGFEPGLPGQYGLLQQLEETAFQFRGISIQHELHWKRVRDHLSGRRVRMRGGYWNVGYFLHQSFRKIPRRLEVAGRYAFVDPAVGVGGDRIGELGGAVNWFFNGHNNKLTLDVSRYGLVDASGRQRSRVGARLQWDVSF